MRRSTGRAVVLGADIEGLAAAATLAQAGLTVQVVDELDEPGGLSAPLEFHPGHRVPGLLHETALVRRKLLAPLELEQHGLRWRSAERALHVWRENGEGLMIAREALGASPSAAAYGAWREFMDKLSPLISSLIDEPAPQASERGLVENLRLARQATALRTLGERDMMELLRIATMPAWDWLEERFEDPALRAGLAALVLPGTVIGPRAAGTSALLLMREATRGLEPEGGLSALVAALVKSCRERGVQFLLGSQVECLQASSAGAVCGVQLTAGAALPADLVLSAQDPRKTLLQQLPVGLLPQHVENEVDTWRQRGSSAIVLLALSKTTELAQEAERWISAGTALELERAADALKYAELPSQPWLDVRDWGRSDAGCAPGGQGTLSVHVHGVPRTLAGGWNAEARTRLCESVLETLERRAGVSRESIVARELLTPADLEERWGVAGGHLYGGELALDQLWLQRPSLALCRHQTPVPGLYLCGAASHPGGPWVGGAGVLGARRALR